MTKYAPANHHRAPPGPVPARCLQCGQAAVMEVRNIKNGMYSSYEWQVRCRLCRADWQPGYPLAVPGKQ